MKGLRCVSRKFWKTNPTTQVVGNPKEHPRSWATELSPTNWYVQVIFAKKLQKVNEKAEGERLKKKPCRIL